MYKMQYYNSTDPVQVLDKYEKFSKNDEDFDHQYKVSEIELAVGMKRAQREDVEDGYLICLLGVIIVIVIVLGGLGTKISML